MICASAFLHPDLGVMKSATEVFEDLLESDDGHPQMGKEMKGHILAAGFENLRMTGTIDIYSTPKAIAFVHALFSEWFLSPEIVEASLKYGATTLELSERMRAALEQWRHDSGAVAGLSFGQAIASKPYSSAFR